MITETKIQFLGKTFELADSVISDVQIILGAKDRSNSCSITFLDPGFKISDLVFSYSKKNEGIKVSSDLLGQQQQQQQQTNNLENNPTNTGSTGNNGSKLEGLENEPLSVSAFMETIGWCENKGYNKGNLVYNIIFTGRTFSSYTDHPRQVICSGSLCSSASGAFQFLSTTWDGIKGKAGVKDFSPRSQNIAAWTLIKTNSSSSASNIRNGSDNAIINAARGLNRIWASLPGSPYGQPTVNNSMFLSKYKQILARRKSSGSNPGYTPVIDDLTGNEIDISGWLIEPKKIDYSKVVYVYLDRHHHSNNDIREALNYLIQQNNLEGSYYLSEKTNEPIWRSKNLTSDEKLQYEAILHSAGLLIDYSFLKEIDGYHNQNLYGVPENAVSPNSQQSKEQAKQNNQTNELKGNNLGTSEGEKITITFTTDSNKTYNYSFILTGIETSEMSNPTTTIRGQSIKANLVTTTKANKTNQSLARYSNVNPVELAQILAYENDIRTEVKSVPVTEKRDYLVTENRLDAINQATSTPGIIAYSSTGSDGDKIVLTSSESKGLILPNILSLQFSDEAVVDKKPQYPVNIKTLISDETLNLKPETSIGLASVYNRIPKSLKDDEWVVNTITHNLAQKTSSIALQKYIPVDNETTGSSGGWLPTLSESQILNKYKKSVVRIGDSSGVFVSSDGYILTAYHVRMDKNIVRTFDNKTSTYTIIGSDPAHDLMLVKISGSGYTPIPLAEDSRIWKTDKSLSTNPIYKIGHGWTTEDGNREGSKVFKLWDITATKVISINTKLDNGLYIIADDKSVDFVNPGDSGCPWIDKFGLLVSVTSGGDRQHKYGAGKGYRAWGSETKPIINLLDKYQVKYNKKARYTQPTTNGSGSIVTGSAGSVNQKIVAALHRMGKFSTVRSGLGRLACAWATNQVLKNAGVKTVGKNTNYVPSLRADLRSGRGTRISASWANPYQGALPGDIFIFIDARHVGLMLTSTICRNTSSSRQDFSNDDPTGILWGTYARGTFNGRDENTTPEVWRLKY